MSSAPATTIDSIKRSLVGLHMPRALEVLDATLRRIEQGEIDGIGALDQILMEELTLRENRRVKTALVMARLPAIKTLQGFDFAFQPSLDRNRIMVGGAEVHRQGGSGASSGAAWDRQEPSRHGPGG